jgi:hypothetical protein
MKELEKMCEDGGIERIAASDGNSRGLRDMGEPNGIVSE